MISDDKIRELFLQKDLPYSAEDVQAFDHKALVNIYLAQRYIALKGEDIGNKIEKIAGKLDISIDEVGDLFNMLIESVLSDYKY